jgi:hypothetical protein
MARKILTDLNLAGELELNGSAGSSGQVLISSGAGAVPSWSSAPGVGAMNYAQTQATKQSTISASGVTLVSASITTSGYPVQVLVTGDAENNSAGAWVQLQLYRGSTAIGKIIHVEGSAGSENIPYALTVIDTPVAGTYTYSLKTANAPSGGTFNFGETDGPVLTAIELAGPKGDTGAAGTANSFATISTPSGTSPVADSSTDTLTYTAAGGLTITGDSSTDTIAFSTNAASANGASTLVIRDSAGSFAANVITATTVSATTISGSGSGLTNLNGSNVASGTVADARIASALTGKTYNGLTVTTTTGTLTVTNLKTFSVSNTLTLAGTDSTTMTFPSTSATIARTDAAQTFTGSQTVRPAATQDSVIIAGRAGGTGSFGVTITPTTLTASRTATLPDFTGNIAVISGTLAVDVGKTLTVSRTLTLTGTDSTTMTFPSTSATIARTDAAQTFTGAQTLTPAAAVAATAASTAGYIGMPQNSQSGAYTLVAGDAGKHIYYTVTGQTVTIPANSSVAFEIGTTITFITAPSVSLSIAITTDTLRLANTSTTGTRTLAANGIATAIKTTATTWIISGNGLT